MHVISHTLHSAHVPILVPLPDQPGRRVSVGVARDAVRRGHVGQRVLGQEEVVDQQGVLGLPGQLKLVNVQVPWNKEQVPIGSELANIKLHLYDGRHSIYAQYRYNWYFIKKNTNVKPNVTGTLTLPTSYLCCIYVLDIKFEEMFVDQRLKSVEFIWADENTTRIRIW